MNSNEASKVIATRQSAVQIVLNLNEREAQDLLDLTYYGISGSPVKTTRGVFDRIYESLRDQGMRKSEDRNSSRVRGVVTFYEEP